VLENDSIMVTPPHATHLGSKEKHEHKKQFGKRDNVHQRPLGITQFFENIYLKNTIKSVFDVNLHHGQIRM
jgi:hypothetical protein